VRADSRCFALKRGGAYAAIGKCEQGGFTNPMRCCNARR
jgi:hypothetical protein